MRIGSLGPLMKTCSHVSSWHACQAPHTSQPMDACEHCLHCSISSWLKTSCTTNVCCMRLTATTEWCNFDHGANYMECNKGRRGQVLSKNMCCRHFKTSCHTRHIRIEAGRAAADSNARCHAAQRKAMGPGTLPCCTAAWQLVHVEYVLVLK